MKKITIGLIPSPDVSQKLVDKIIDKLKINIAKKLDKNIDWQFEVKVNTFVGAAEYVNETIQKVIEMKERNNWDYAVSINDLPSISEGKVVISDIGTKDGVGFVSLPSFGAFPFKKRIVKAITYIIELLYNKEYKKAEKINKKINWNYIFSNVKHVTPEKAVKTDVRLILQSRIIGLLRVLAGMVYANKPWKTLGSFKTILTLAFATGTYISIFSTPWQLSVAYTPGRFILLMSLSMIGMVVWMIFAHHLWEKSTSKTQIQYRRLYNMTTVMTLAFITVMNYLVLFVVFALSISIFVPEGIFDAATKEGANNSIENYLRLAWLATSLGLLVGAIGTTVEEEDEIRKITYSYRQRNRYYETEQGEDEFEDKESYGGVQQTHKEQDD